MPGPGPSPLDAPVRTSRRRVLAGLGTGALAAFGGCAGVVENRPSYGNRTDVDADGDERTADEMTAAEAVAEREVTDGVEVLDALSVERHEFVLKDDFRRATVEGTVANTDSDRIRTVEVRVRVYNDAGEHLGRYVATTGDVDGDSTWAFEVVLLESPDDIGAYDLAVLGATT